MKTILAGAVGALLMVSGAVACEEMDSVKIIKISSEFSVRGFSYWTDKSPVTVSWQTGEKAGMAAPDQNGEWSLVLTAPEKPGTYTLVARQNRADSEPVKLTIDVVDPTKMAALSSEN